MEERDRKLWRLAQKRAGFKKNLASYAVANIFFWVIWYMTTKGAIHGFWPWPMWITVFWGIGIIYGYVEAYHSDKDSMAEREYQKLKDKEK